MSRARFKSCINTKTVYYYYLIMPPVGIVPWIAWTVTFKVQSGHFLKKNGAVTFSNSSFRFLDDNNILLRPVFPWIAVSIFNQGQNIFVKSKGICNAFKITHLHITLCYMTLGNFSEKKCLMYTKLRKCSMGGGGGKS